MRGRVVVQFAVFFQLLQIFDVDAGYIAKRMSQYIGIRIITLQIGFYITAGEAVLIDGEFSNLLFIELFGQCQRIKFPRMTSFVQQA